MINKSSDKNKNESPTSRINPFTVNWNNHCPVLGANVKKSSKNLTKKPENSVKVKVLSHINWLLFVYSDHRMIMTRTDLLMIIKNQYRTAWCKHTSLWSALWSEAPGWDFPVTPSAGWTGSSRAFAGRPAPRILTADWLSGQDWREDSSCADAACDASLETPDHLQEDQMHRGHMIIWTSTDRVRVGTIFKGAICKYLTWPEFKR